MKYFNLLLCLVLINGFTTASGWSSLTADSGSRFTSLTESGSSGYVNSTVFQADDTGSFNTGSFNRTTAGKSGTLRLGYLNGTSSGQPLSTSLNNDGLKVFMRFDDSVDGNGSPVEDYSGNSGDGTVFNSVESTEGVFGTSGFSLDRSDSEKVVGDDLGILTSTSEDEYTVSIWIKTKTSRDFSGVAQLKSFTGLFLCNDGGFSVQSAGDNAGTCPAMQDVTDGSWHHLVGAYDEGSRYVGWKDGNLVFNKSTSDLEGSNSANFTIGERLGADDHLTAKIDEVRVYDRLLTTSDVEELYIGGTGGNFSGSFEKTVSGQDNRNWQRMEVNTQIPSETDLSAVFKAKDSGSVVSEEVFELSSGSNTLDLQPYSSPDAELQLNGSSSNASKSWKVNSIKLLERSLKFESLT